MQRATSNLEHLLCKLRLRTILVRSAERFLVCAFGIACLIIIARWLFQQASTWPFIVFTMAVIGVVWTWRSIPSRSHLAQMIDEQLQLADLLSTALWISHDAQRDSSWARMIHQQAEARCAADLSGSIRVKTLTERTWGAMGLIVIATIILAVFTQAPTSEPSSRRLAVNEQSTGDPSVSSKSQQQTSPVVRSQPVSHQRARRSDPEPAESIEAADAEHVESDVTQVSDAKRLPDEGDDTSAGNGQSITEDNSPMKPVAPSNGQSPDSGLSRQIAGGTSRAEGDRRTRTNDIDGSTSHAEKSASSWRSSDWSRQQQAAREAITTGQVPARHRGMLREYFSTDSMD